MESSQRLLKLGIVPTLILTAWEAITGLIEVSEVFEASGIAKAGSTTWWGFPMQEAMDRVLRVLGAAPHSRGYVRDPGRESIKQKRSSQAVRNAMPNSEVEQGDILPEGSVKESPMKAVVLKPHTSLSREHHRRRGCSLWEIGTGQFVPRPASCKGESKRGREDKRREFSKSTAWAC